MLSSEANYKFVHFVPKRKISEKVLFKITYSNVIPFILIVKCKGR